MIQILILFFHFTQPFSQLPDQEKEAKPEFREVHREILNRLYEIDLPEIQEIFKNRKHELDNSSITMLLENYYDFLVIQLKDEYPLYKDLKKRKNNRIGYIQNINTPNLNWKNYTQAQIHLQWGIARLKLEFYTRGIWDTRLAFQQLIDNNQDFPNFKPTLMSLGLLQTLVGAIPKSRGKWMKLIGIQGDLIKGLEKMQESTSRENPFWYESEMLLAYCEGYLLNRELAGKTRLEKLQKKKKTLLADLVQAIYLMKIRETQLAIGIINKRIDQCPEIVNPHFHFLLGDAMFRKGLYREAIYHLKYFLFHYKGMTLRKEANYKVSLAYYLDGNMEKAQDYWVRTARLGYTFVSSDHYAQKEFEGGAFPNKSLLKARLFFDGGYYSESREELIRFAEKKHVVRQLATEYYYRKGRIEQAEGNLGLALANYQKCIKHQGQDQWYFAPNAWLQSAYIYTEQAENEKAILAFEKSSKYPKNPYQESIDSKAQIGSLLLNRNINEDAKDH
jgi:hypothetical protein